MTISGNAMRTGSAAMGDGGHATVVMEAGGQAVLQVPGGNFLLGAQFGRDGHDLELVGADGSRVVIVGYFRTDHPPALATASGATVSPNLAATLAGPLAPGQYAQAGGQLAAVEIGYVDILNGSVTVRHANGSVAPLAKGQIVYQDDVLETGQDGGVGIVFADRSTFSLGPMGRMTLDELVYDADTRQGTSSISVVKGAFSFISGQTAKTAPGSAVVKTPVMTIGIRGTSAAGEVTDTGETQVVLLTDRDGTVGQLLLTNGGGTMVINQPFTLVAVSSYLTPPPPPILVTSFYVERTFGVATQHLPTRPAAHQEWNTVPGNEQNAPTPDQQEQNRQQQQQGPPQDTPRSEGPAPDTTNPSAPPTPPPSTGADTAPVSVTQTALGALQRMVTATVAPGPSKASASPAPPAPSSEPQTGNNTPEPQAPPANTTKPTVTAAAVSGSEDSAVAFSAADFTSHFTGEPGHALALVRIDSLPAHGTLRLNGTVVTAGTTIAAAELGALTFAPNTDWNGSDSFTWSASDGTDYAAAATTMTIAVAAANDRPTVGAAGTSGREDSPVAFTAADFTSHYSDVEGSALAQVRIDSLPAHGTLTLNGTVVTAGTTIAAAELGALTFAPAADWNGSDSFIWSGSDGTDYSAAAATMTIAVTASNDAPTVTATSVSGSEDGAVTFSAAAFANAYADVDGDALARVRIDSLPAHGTLTLNGAAVSAGTTIAAADLGALAFTPDHDWNGSTSFSWSGFDGTDYSATAATMTIMVANATEAPSLTGMAGALTFDGSANAAINTTLGSAVDLTNGDFTIEAWVKSIGGSQAIVTKQDGDNIWETGEKAFYIDSAGMPTFVGHSNDYITSTLAVNDGLWHHVAVVFDHDGGTGSIYVDGVDRTGSVTYHATVADNSTDTVWIGMKTRTDADASSNFDGPIADVRLWNVARSADEIGAARNATLAATTPGLVANFLMNELDGSTIASSNGSYTGTSLAPLRPAIAYTENGAAVILAPRLALDDVDSATLAGATIWISSGRVTGDHLNFTDQNGITGSYDPASGVLTLAGSASVADYQAALRTVSFSSTSDNPGILPRTVSFTASDGTAASTAVTATVAVTAVNDGPTASGPTNLGTIAEDVPTTITLAQLLGNTHDPDSNPLSVSGLTATNGTLTYNGGDAWTFTPNANFNGSSTFSYTVSDGQYSVAHSASLTITAVNDAPIVAGAAGPLALLRFDGNDRAATTDTVTLGAHSVEARIRTSDTTAYAGIVSSGFGLGTGAFAQLALGNSGRLLVELDDGLSHKYYTTATVVNDGAWHNVAYTTDGSTLQVYIDGQLDTGGSWNENGTLAFSLTDTLKLGVNRTNTVGFKGDIADVRVWNTARTQAQIGATGKIALTGNEPGLVANWRFDEVANGVVADKAGGDQPLMLAAGINAPVALTQPAMAMHFDGIDDKATVIAPVSLANQSFTWEFWAKRASSTTNDFVLGQGIAASGQGLQVGYSAGNIFSFSFYFVDMNYADSSNNVGQWVHWAGSYDATTNAKILYKNGIQVAAETATADYVGSGPLYIGNTTWASNAFHGDLADIRIWSGVRSATELAIYGNGAVSPSDPGLIGSWSLGTTTGLSLTSTPGVVTASPALGTQTFVIRENATLESKLFASDVEGSSLTYAVASGPAHGVLTLETDGSFRYVPTAGYAGTDSFVFNVGDGAAVTSNTVTVTVDAAEEVALPAVADRHGLDFDGIDDYVAVANLSTGTSALTYEAWIKTSKISGREDILAVGDDAHSLTGAYLSVNNGQLAFSLANGGNVSSSAMVADGQWHHVAATLAADGTVLLYVDGTADGSGSMPGYAIGSGAAYIGRSHSPSLAFDGEISDVRVWTAARAASQVKLDMAGSPLAADPDLLAWYTFAEGSGAVLHDHTSAGGHDGTVASSPQWTDVALAATGQDTPLCLAGMVLTDRDSHTPASLTMSLVAQHGTVVLGDTTGLTFASGHGNGTDSVIFSGSENDIEAALAAAIYLPDLNYTGRDTLDIQVSEPAGMVERSIAILVHAPLATTGNDMVTGTAAADILPGLAGNDVLSGLGGNDTLLGGPGNDTLLGGDGNDWLMAESGADSLFGNAGNDHLVVADAGFATVAGGGGNDVLHFTGSTLDFTALADIVQGIEQVDLLASGTQTLTLALADVQGMVDGVNGATASAETLLVIGSGDIVNLTGGGWTMGPTGLTAPSDPSGAHSYTQYANSGGAIVLVSDGNTVNLS